MGYCGGLITPSSCTACSYMPLGRDRKRWRDSSAKANGKPYPSQIPMQPYLPYNWWAIRPPGKKSGTCTMRYTYYGGHLAHFHVGLTERRSYPEHLVLTEELFATAGVLQCWKRTTAVWLPLPTGQSATQKPSPGPAREGAHMTRPSGRPGKLTSRHWKLPTYWSLILRD